MNDLVDRKLIRNIDLGVVLSTIALICVGMVAIYSATIVPEGGSTGQIKMQIISFVLGIIAIFFILLIDYKNFGEFSKPIFIINVLLLVSVLVFGQIKHGAKCWINLGPWSFQPSEMVKIGFILTFAKHLEKRKDNLKNIKDIAPYILHLGVIVGLLLLEPDFGTALVFIFVAAFMIFAAGLNWKMIAYAIGTVLVSIPAIWFFYFGEYQKARIMVFFNPELDPMGRGYHVLQSKIAIGSGQFLGTGLFKGVQNKLGFIPFKETDFIFSVIGEEMGLIGTVLVVLLFTWLLLRCIHVARVSKDDYGMLICVGITAMFLFHVLENIGMTIGIMPVTGIPLPFISSGGTSLLANLIAIGLVLNVGMRRQVIRF
jgi:rod shape determining protein RodA